MRNGPCADNHGFHRSRPLPAFNHLALQPIDVGGTVLNLCVAKFDFKGTPSTIAGFHDKIDL